MSRRESYRRKQHLSQTMRLDVNADDYHLSCVQESDARKENLEDLVQRSSTIGHQSDGSRFSNEGLIWETKATHFEHIEYDIKFDGILTSHAVIHLAGVSDPVQNE